MAIVVIGCIVCSLVFTLATVVLRDTIIIEHGIRTWSMLHSFSIAAWAATACAAIVFCIFYCRKRSKSAADSRAKQMKKQEEEEKSRQDSAYLDPSHLDPDAISSAVHEQIRLFGGTRDAATASDGDPDLRGAILQSYLKLDEQMSEMDRYQEKLKHMLTSNGADSLSDMNDMLDKIEQHLLQQIRKVLNLQDLYSVSSRTDMEQLRRLLSDAVALNETHLSHVREFLFAVAEFLNNQGSGDSDLKMLENCRQTILDTIREQENTPLSGLTREDAQAVPEDSGGIRLTF